MLFDEPAGLGEVVVPVTDAPGCREADAVNQAGMYELVGQDKGLGIADGGKDAGIGVVPAIEDQGGLCPEEPGEFVLQLGIAGEVAGEQAIAGEVAGEQAGRRGGGQEGIGGQCLQKCFPQAAVGCQSEVIVGGEVQHALAVDDDVPAVVYEDWKVAQVAGRFQLLELLVHEVHISFS